MMPQDTEQGTEQWKDARAGHVTASRISDVMTKPRKGQKESTMRANYRAQIVSEILSGKANPDEYMSWDMRRGLELEPNARIEYEMKTGLDVQKVGFIPHPTIARAGASPDGFVGEDGLLQIKCPKPATHLTWLLEGIVPLEHRPQMYFEMACTGKKWNEFLSYDPGLTGHELFIARLERDDAEIEAIEVEVVKFNREVDEIIARLAKPDPMELTQEDVRFAHKGRG
jgi:hypothetical protein